MYTEKKQIVLLLSGVEGMFNVYKNIPGPQGIPARDATSDIIVHMEPDMSHVEMKRMLEKNAELVKENNKLLKKIHRNSVIGFWAQIIWYMLLIGIPFALYFYLLEPYFQAFGASFEVFSEGMQEIPGVKKFNEVLDSYNGR